MENYLVVENINEKGYGIIPKLVMQDKNLSIESKAIYSYFCSYAGAGNQAFPSINKIMSDLGIGKNRFYKHLNLLKDNGYITTKQHKNNSNKFTNTVYTLCSKIEKPCIQNRDTQNRDTQIGDTQNDTTNINSIKNNSIKNNRLNNNIESVVVDNPSYDNLDKEIKEKLDIKINKKVLTELINTKGEEKIKEYINNFNKFKSKDKDDKAGFFVDAVRKEYQIPKSEKGVVENMHNFEQRQYTTEDFDKYYYKVTE